MYIHAIIKFGNRKWMDEFQKGKIHFKQLKQFQDFEKKHDNAKRGDKYEGAHMVLSPAQNKIVIGNYELDSNDLVGPIRTYKNSSSKNPIFCLYTLTEEIVESFLTSNRTFLIDPKVQTFGDTAVYITDFKEFLNRFESALNKQLGIGYSRGLVEYVDVNEVNGEWGAFRKPREYDFQSEYRLLINSPINDPSIDLDIGDISDITISMPIESIQSIELQTKL